MFLTCVCWQIELLVLMLEFILANFAVGREDAPAADWKAAPKNIAIDTVLILACPGMLALSMSLLTCLHSRQVHDPL